MKLVAHTHKNSGLTLIELMISMLLGIILIGGVIQIYISNSETRRIVSSMQSISENVQFAFEHMNRHLRITGYEAAAEVSFSEASGAEVLSVEIDSGAVSYSFDENQLLFNDETLIRGVTGWNVELGLGDPSTGSMQFIQAMPGVYEDVWAIRVALVVEDVTSPGNPLTLANGGEISTTIALRNPVFAVMAQSMAPVNSGSIPVPDNPPDNGDEDVDADADAGNDDPETTDPEQEPGDGNSNGADGGDGNDSDAGNNDAPESSTPLPTFYTCNCYFQNNRRGYRLTAGSFESCSVSDCEERDTGNGNNRGFSITVNN